MSEIDRSIGRSSSNSMERVRSVEIHDDDDDDAAATATAIPEAYTFCENDDYCSDESEHPSGERWAPVGANDGDNDFGDEYKCSSSNENPSYNTDRLKALEEEQEMLNSSLIALTTHFAQVQFRLRQIVDAPASEKERLLKELEEFAFGGVPDVSNNPPHSGGLSETPPLSRQQNNFGFPNDDKLESKLAVQRSKQRELIERLKLRLQELEAYAYETGGQDPLRSAPLERQNVAIDHSRDKFNFNVEDMCELPEDDLRRQVDRAITQIVSPLKMKEQLVTQLKTQIVDLERFINYLQGEVSVESLACSCACPVHAPGSATIASGTEKTAIQQTNGEENRAKTLNTAKKVVDLLQMFVISQLGCGSDQVRRSFQKNSIYNWRDLRTRLDIAIEHVLETIAETNRRDDDDDDDDDDDNDNNDNENESIYTSDSDGSKTHSTSAITLAIRNHLAVRIRDLMQHGLISDVRTSSVIQFVGCFPQKNVSSNNIHIWELVVKYYEVKNGRRYVSSPAQKLSQSFNLDLVTDRGVSPKQTLLITIGNIISSHTLYKRSYDSQFKAFICAALNAKKLVTWLKLILQCQYLLENYYASWSYVVKTGFQDAFHALDRLTSINFALPVDLAIRQFQNIKDAF